MGWVSWPLYILVFLASFSALWWPNIWPKICFPKLFEKTIGSIHFIPDIYPYGASLLTPIYFGVPSLIFGPLVVKYLAENGVSGNLKKKLLAQLISFLKNSHLCSTRLQSRNLYWIFLDEVGSDQRGVYCPHLWAQLVVIIQLIHMIVFDKWYLNWNVTTTRKQQQENKEIKYN